MTVQSPIPDYAAARRAMVESKLRPIGVTDPAVLAAMGGIERERFVPDDVRPLAYGDRAVALGERRFLPPPSLLGQLLTQMATEPGQRALVVGAGTGYSAAVLAHMGLEVVAIECSPKLAGGARELGIAVVEGPLEAGWRKAAPYRHILIDGAVEAIPDAIVPVIARYLEALNMRVAGIDLMWVDDDVSRDPLVLEVSPYFQPNPEKPPRYAHWTYKQYKAKPYARDGYFREQYRVFREIAAEISDQGLF